MTSNVFPAIIKAQYDPSGGFPKMVQDAKSSLSDVRREFEREYGAIKKLTGDALAIPRNASGSLDLNVGQYKAAADNARLYATGLREVANAAASAAKSSGDTTRATQTYIQAASAAAREAEREARAITATATTYERLQAELNQTKSAAIGLAQATASGTTAFGAQATSLRGIRQASVQSAQQIQDLGISLYSGQRASTVFAQQLPQLAFALTSLDGAANKTAARIGAFATMLSGPLGSVALVGASIGIGVLVEKLFFAEDASDKAAKSTLSLVDALSKEKFGTEEATKAIDEYVKAQEGARNSVEKNITLLLASANARLKETITTREQIAAEYELQKAYASRSTRGAGGGIDPLIVANSRYGSALDANQVALDRARKLVNELTIQDAKLGAESAVDPIKRINRQYDDMAAAAERAAVGNQKLANSLKATLTGIEKNREAALAAQKDASKSTGSSLSQQSNLGGMIALIKELFPGAAITSTFRKGDKGDHGAYRAIDFVPQGGVGKYTTEEVERILENAGVDIRYNATGKKQIFGPGRAAKTKGDHDDHFHFGFNGAADPEKASARAAQETERLSRISDSAAESILRINEQFDDQPRLVDQSAQAVRRLQSVIDELNDPKNAGTPRNEQIKAEAKQAQEIARNAIVTDFGRQTEQFENRLQIQRLILAGREDEARVVEKIQALEERYGLGKKLDEQREHLRIAQEILATEDASEAERAKAQATISESTTEYERLLRIQREIYATVTRQTAQEIALNDAIDKRNDSLARYQSVVSGTYGALEDLLSGGKAKDFFKTIRDQFQQLRGQNLAESLFGDAFRELKRFTERNNPENVAVRNLVEQTDTVATNLKGLADTILNQTNRISGAANDNLPGSTVPSAAGGVDPNDLIVVTGSIKKAIVDGNRYNYGQFASATANSIINPLLAKLDETFGTRFFGQLSGVLSGALAGYMRAGKVGGVLGGLKGAVDGFLLNSKISLKTNAALTKVTAGLGKALAGAETGDQTAMLLRSFGVKTSRTGGQIGGALGQVVGGPIGGIIGSVLGSVVGGMFKKTPKGSTTISNLNDDLAYTGSGKLKSGVLGLGGNVKSSLSSIIEQLGGTAGTFSVSIGQRGKNFVVDPTGRGRTKGSGVQKFKTEEEAARAALMDAIMDGAVQGIKAGAQRLLQSGKDLDAQLQKAVKFQSVFDRLDAIKDPFGSAIRSLNREFQGLIGIFNEAGASAEELSQLEELYGLERAKIIKETSENLTGSLRSLIEDLTQGDNGLALRDRLSNIRAQFDPLATTIRGGGVVDYDRFSELARQLIDVQRQISGSQVDYFAVFNEILGLSQQALAGQQNVISIGSGATSPFAGTAPPSNASTPVVGAIMSQTGTLVASLAAVQAQIANLNFPTGGGGGSARSGISLGGLSYF